VIRIWKLFANVFGVLGAEFQEGLLPFLRRSAIPLAIKASDLPSSSENFSDELPLLITRM
jgi:hypothetical protein